MSLFLSSYENRLDTKGRISVPASFRAALMSENFAGVVLYRSFTNNCIEGLSMSRMEQMAAATDKIGVFDGALDDLSAMLFADARPLPFDEETKDTRLRNEERARFEKTILYAKLLKVKKEWMDLKKVTDSLINEYGEDVSGGEIKELNELAKKELGIVESRDKKKEDKK